MVLGNTAVKYLHLLNICDKRVRSRVSSRMCQIGLDRNNSKIEFKEGKSFNISFKYFCQNVVEINKSPYMTIDF